MIRVLRVRCGATTSWLRTWIYFIYFIDNNYVLFVYTDTGAHIDGCGTLCGGQSSLLTGDEFMAVIRFSNPSLWTPFAKGYRILLFFFLDDATHIKLFFAWCRPKRNFPFMRARVRGAWPQIADVSFAVVFIFCYYYCCCWTTRRRQDRNLLKEISEHRCGTMDTSCRNLTKVCFSFFFFFFCFASFRCSPSAIVHICQRYACASVSAWPQEKKKWHTISRFR